MSSPGPSEIAVILAGLLLLTPGCGGPPTAQAPPDASEGASVRTPQEAPARTTREVRARCADYEGTGSVADYCAYRLVSSVESVDDVLEICGTGGPWSTPCRTAWVEPRLHPDSGTDTPRLLEACGVDEDCRLDVLDHRPLALRAQLDACAAHARSNLRHCVSHAVDRWRAAGARDPDMATLLADPGPAPLLLGEYVAEVVVCDRRGECGGPPGLEQACQDRAEVLRSDRSLCRRAGAPGARPRPHGQRGHGARQGEAAPRRP